MSCLGPTATADGTFEEANLSSLENLNLDGTIFAANGMEITSSSQSIVTAYQTFYKTI
jgi:hypothetical protein